MGQPDRASLRKIAVVVEGDDEQRHLLGTIFEESDVRVMACGTADEAVRLMEKVGGDAVFMFADLTDSRGLAREVESRWPHTYLVTTQPAGRPDMARPQRAKEIERPWRALDLIVELERAIAAH
jgi:DNA-binding NtrC family response regulator